jgi:twitching motility two-component system response regulator PilH
MPTPRRILVVEDDAAIREMFSDVLRAAGMDVMEAADGMMAFTATSVVPPDLVITDIAMPRMDGIELTRALRHQSSTRRVPIIAVTGEQAVFARARDAGCTAIVSKPCAARDLVMLVEHFIGRQHENRTAEALKPWSGDDRRSHPRPS